VDTSNAGGVSMDRDEFMRFHEAFCEKARGISRAKNQDYAGHSDPFANFRRCEQLALCSTEVGIMVRMSDKFQRIANYMNNGKLSVQDEKVDDTLLDLCNYAIILAAYIGAKQR
jgi:hypothetical protein